MISISPTEKERHKRVRITQGIKGKCLNVWHYI